MSQQAILPMVRCLALCLAVLVGSGECMASSVVEQHRIEADVPPSRVPTRGFNHDVSAHDKPSFLHRLISAIEVKAMAIPPEIIETIEHKKIAGNGYAKGSPLYERYEAFKNASAIASLKEVAPHDPGSPSYVATALMLMVSGTCIAGAHLMAGSGHVPNKDITTGSMIPRSEASLEESMRVPYGGRPPSPRGGRPSYPPTAMPPGSMQQQPFGTSMPAGSLSQPGPYGTSMPAAISSVSVASNRSRSPMARPGSPSASSQTPSQVGYPSMGQILSPPQSHASQPQAHNSWHSLPTQAMPTQPMPVSPMQAQAQPLSPPPTGGFGN